ncbi:hypothetical protein C2S53_018140 [Perilla frutescens var. hirtella]|uniref:Uncharacterized protein n=1 Tax=Perilla frutescens var. hirtella TaxID=608512 RepID=A0AAD4JMU9_PERFH|nr:hypothetical protein C2S53_018140 [Perilla frutescens var. hirtella]
MTAQISTMAKFGQKNNDKLSYGNPNNFQQPLPGFSTINGVINESPKPDLENILGSFMTATKQRMDTEAAKVNNLTIAFNKFTSNMGAQLKSMEIQIGQLAKIVGSQQQKGQYPSNTEVNPEEQCNGITKDGDKETTTVVEEASEPKYVPHPTYVPPLPFPQRQKKQENEVQLARFLNIFKKLSIIIHFVEALEKM